MAERAWDGKDGFVLSLGKRRRFRQADQFGRRRHRLDLVAGQHTWKKPRWAEDVFLVVRFDPGNQETWPPDNEYVRCSRCVNGRVWEMAKFDRDLTRSGWRVGDLWLRPSCETP